MLPKQEFTRLVAGLSDDQYARMLEALVRADVDLPGWRDRSLTVDEQLHASDPISIQLPFAAWRRALQLARRVAKDEQGVWILAGPNSVVIVGADNRAAARTSIEATVDVQGIAVVNEREAFLVTEALAKGITGAHRRTAMITIQAEDDAYVRLSINGRSHRAGLQQRGATPPVLPPIASAEVVVADAGDLRRAILHVWSASESRRSDDVLRLDRVGLRALDGMLSLDATDRYRAAEANFAASHEHAFEAFVDAAWLREVSDALTHGQVQIGIAQEHGTSVFMIAGDGWHAWTTSVGAWRPRYRAKAEPGRVSATVTRKDLLRFLREADRLATAGKQGPSDGCIRASIEPGVLRISGLNNDDESASIGSTQLPAGTGDLADTVIAYLDTRRSIEALRSFSNDVVTVHLDGDRMVHVTLSGSMPDELPHLMWSMVGRRAPGEGQN